MKCHHLAVTAVVVTALPLWAPSAQAHHSYAMFDATKTITVQGTVKDFQWTNPHVWIDLLVVDPASGATQGWSIEGNSVIILKRLGWERDSLKPGDKVSITLHPLKNGSNGGQLVAASVDGKVIGHGFQ